MLKNTESFAYKLVYGLCLTITIIALIIFYTIHLPILVYIAILFILVIFSLLWFTDRLRAAPNILTTLGILCTFIGISWGLLKFNIDNDNLSGSIDSLLAGLKFSFIPSAFGIFFALVSKSAAVVKDKSSHYTKTTTMSLQDLAEIFKNGFNDSTNRIINKWDEQHNKIALHLVDIRRDLKEFKEEIVANNTTALIEALQNVLNDFNTKISDHLGDNFKALNIAVQNLVAWQDNYKSIIENTNVDYTKLLDKNKVLLDIMSSSINNIDYLNQKIHTANEHIISFSSNMLETHNKLSNAANNIGNETRLLVKSCSDITKNIDNHATNIAKATFTILESISEGHKGLQGNIVNFGQESKNMLQETRELLTQQIKGINSSITELEEATKKQIENLDKALETEINKTLEGLGKGLTAVSQKFVDDYTPLTDKLRDLVGIARG